MSGASAYCFTPMQEEHLDWVSACEVELHTFPWTSGNFLDSMAAGHGSWVMSAGTDNAYQLAKKYKVKTAFGTDCLFDASLAKRQGKQLANPWKKHDNIPL